MIDVGRSRSAPRRARLPPQTVRGAVRAGKIPAVLYGHGTDPVHLSLPSLQFAAVVREQGRNAVLELDVDGSSPQLALTKTVVVHPLRPYIEHVDLLVIKRGEKVEVELDVVVTGEAAPGSLVTQDLNTVLVEADVLNIPENIEISVEDAEIGTQYFAKDLKLPGGVELRTDEEYLVVQVVPAPTEEDLEAEVDAEGAGVVEEPSDEEQAAEAETEGDSAEGSADSEGDSESSDK